MYSVNHFVQTQTDKRMCWNKVAELWKQNKNQPNTIIVLMNNSEIKDNK